uniref:Phosphatidylinositol N-acetylglucosaminyltransferase subunit C n=1 Tax=Trichogramma kaykai TaxID=54128 RepID=A0ABD2XF82_9HYME
MMNSQINMKNLYEFHGQADNCTDKSFHENLKKNSKPASVETSKIFIFCAKICFKLSLIMIFMIIFNSLSNGTLIPFSVFTINSIIGFLCYSRYVIISNHRVQNFSKDLHVFIIFLVFSYILSPVFKNLTETVSTDTVYALTTFMFVIHLLLNKYGLSDVSLTQSLSITSSLFGSIMLTSRLPSTLHAFCLLLTSVQSFVLLPKFLFKIANPVSLCLFTVSLTAFILYNTSYILLHIFLLISLFMQLICPLFFVKWQVYKENIYGPWDEAIIQF